MRTEEAGAAADEHRRAMAAAASVTLADPVALSGSNVSVRSVPHYSSPSLIRFGGPFAQTDGWSNKRAALRSTTGPLAKLTRSDNDRVEARTSLENLSRRAVVLTSLPRLAPSGSR